MTSSATSIRVDFRGDLSVTTATAVIDDLSQAFPSASNGMVWELISDHVMGGISNGMVLQHVVQDRPAIQMQGDVSLENNGGFLQIALDLAVGGGSIDASRWSGLEFDVLGNDQSYNVHLRTAAVTRPWQSYRHGFVASAKWRTLRLPFVGFEPHRIEMPLDVRVLRRVGVVAIGRAFHADVAVGGLRFYA
jgi:hypothetical protein